MSRNRSVDWVCFGDYFETAVKDNVFLFIKEVKQRGWWLQRECMEFNLISAKRKETKQSKIRASKDWFALSVFAILKM